MYDVFSTVRIETRRRFIERRERCSLGQHASEGDALPFAAGELARQTITQTGEAEIVEGRSSPGPGSGDAAEVERDLNVVEG